ncbi:hypothetical protein IscW_ISCW013016 [Ixodes scapularis]|uniref:Uncharacterized protein n=1 Tax=Ixodes scapularis TaxID=6945 RepID=B7QE22_IXOSC|nr:hypothetical protein IscW_ISCW013016 [Ixodes scapularis]|eukprot:XP_002413786.1 hypothetical protein IscW_ISCW013016 [Ixodes scapularis]
MAAAVASRRNRMAPLKSHAFDVSVPAGTPPDATLNAAIALVTVPEVYPVQHLGGVKF